MLNNLVPQGQMGKIGKDGRPGEQGEPVSTHDMA